MENEIQVFGTNWCGLTFAVREYLTRARIPYDYHNVEQDLQADEFMMNLGDGRRRLPLVIVGDRVLTSPTLAELQRVLNEQRVSSVSR
jgi:thioredoxin reductase (NADPH)